MSQTWQGRFAVAGLAALALWPGLGSSARLTYHEAFVVQAAREMLEGGDGLVPTIGGRPWLEKPPLAHWLAAASARLLGPGEAAARLPSTLAAAGLALTVAGFAAHRFGPRVGLLAGAAQATCLWAVRQGRLAEADMLLAALVTAAIVAFDRLREGGRGWRWAFFALLGATALAKGIGFGAALVLATVVAAAPPGRRRATLRRLADPAGLAVALGIALAWPLAVLGRHPEALGLWTLHVADRLAPQSRHFAGEPAWAYALAPFFLTLPWTPLALAGARISWRRSGLGGEARSARRDAHRLLLAWAVVPAALVSLASTRNAHYLLYALPPWSVWAALALARIAARLRRRGMPRARLARGARLAFPALAAAYGLGFALLGPRLDRRGVEWSFYGTIAPRLAPSEPLVLLGDDWDRDPYPTPFGPVPHDLAVRLYYLDRPASWCPSPGALRPPARSFAVIARARDEPALRAFGRVSPLARGPGARRDRAFTLYRVAADPGPARVRR